MLFLLSGCCCNSKETMIISSYCVLYCLICLTVSAVDKKGHAWRDIWYIKDMFLHKKHQCTKQRSSNGQCEWLDLYSLLGAAAATWVDSFRWLQDYFSEPAWSLTGDSLCCMTPATFEPVCSRWRCFSSLPEVALSQIEMMLMCCNSSSERGAS